MNDKLSSMRKAGAINIEAIEEGFGIARPGVTLRQIDRVIEDCILFEYGKPAFKNYQPEGAPTPYLHASCISPNDVAVHGIPGDYVLRDGDLLTIDVGTEYNGYFVDSARSRVIGASNERAEYLVKAVEAILAAQLETVRDQCDFYTMVQAAEAEAIKWGVNIMPQWGGHGIADKIHMPPFIPSALMHSSPLSRRLEEQKLRREKLYEGQTICIEPVTTFGSSDIIIDEDQWTVRQAQGELVAHSERCLLVTKDGYEILS